jgi:hypothetical protein
MTQRDAERAKNRVTELHRASFKECLDGYLASHAHGGVSERR